MQFSPPAKRALALAEREARAWDSRNVEPLHLLLGVLRTDDPNLRAALHSVGQDLYRLTRLLGSPTLPEGSPSVPPAIGHIVAVRRAEEVARVRGSSCIIPLDLLIGVLETADQALRDRLRAAGFPPDCLSRGPEIPLDLKGASGGPMFGKFTERSRKVMSLARQEAQRFGDEFIGTDHILLGIILERGGVASKILQNLNVDPRRVRHELEKLVKPTTASVTLGLLPFSPRSKRVIELACEAAARLGHDVIGTEHLLIGLLEEGEGHGAQVLMSLGLRLDEVRRMMLEFLGVDAAQVPSRVEEIPERDLAKISRQDQYRHLVDRAAVMDTVAQQLLGGRSVALVGPEGVGKTSVALCLARSRLGNLKYRTIDPEWLDPFSRAQLQAGGSRSVLFVPEAELLDSSRSVAAEAFVTGQGLVLLEFLEEGFAAFATRHPELAKEIVPVKIGAPEPAEMWPLLHAARTRLLAATRFTVTDAVLMEANRLAGERVKDPIPPWSTIVALWEAVSIEEDLQIPEELRHLVARIEELERKKDEAISSQEFERAAQLRDDALNQKADRDRLMAEQERVPFDPHVSMEALRRALTNKSNGLFC